jgi:predicted small integral membrane protein
MGYRLVAIVLVALATLYATLVALNNITDYDSNFQFVQHVLRMDTTFAGNRLMWRAIESPVWHHVCYIGIITTESLVAMLGWISLFGMWRARLDASLFNQKKRLASLALTLGIILWFGGFIVIGGEWFLMWQSETWNGTESAFRIAAIFTLFLSFLNFGEQDKGDRSSFSD